MNAKNRVRLNSLNVKFRLNSSIRLNSLNVKNTLNLKLDIIWMLKIELV